MNAQYPKEIPNVVDEELVPIGSAAGSHLGARAFVMLGPGFSRSFWVDLAVELDELAIAEANLRTGELLGRADAGLLDAVAVRSEVAALVARNNI